ncbi:MAG: hypothetical protein MHPSP_002713, partial [Paramarteilia canceri]
DDLTPCEKKYSSMPNEEIRPSSTSLKDTKNDNLSFKSNKSDKKSKKNQKKTKKRSKNLEQDDIIDRMLNLKLYSTLNEVESQTEGNDNKIFVPKSPSIADIRFSKSLCNNKDESSLQKHLSKSSNNIPIKIESVDDNFDIKLKKLQNQRNDPIISAASKDINTSRGPSKVFTDKNSSNYEHRSGDRDLYTFPP